MLPVIINKSEFHLGNISSTAAAVPSPPPHPICYPRNSAALLAQEHLSGPKNTEHPRVADAQQTSHRGTHVVLLLHLIRGDDTFNLAFDTRWRSAFVDSVGDGSGGVGRDAGLPTAVDAAGKSVLEVALGLDPSQVHERENRVSLYRDCGG